MIGAVVRVLRSDKRGRAGDRHADARQVVPFHVGRNIGVRQSTRPPHEIDDHLVHDANNGVFADVMVGHLGGGIVGEDREALLDAGDILGSVIDQEVDVFREAACPMRHDGKAANQHIPRAGVVQGAADSDEVFRFGCSCVRSSILVIHASASLKLEKR